MIDTFDQIIERRHTNSVKWDTVDTVFGEKGLLPMWVADMDFPSPKPVIDALKKRAEHGIFGYSTIPSSTYEAILHWLKKRHGWNVQKNWLTFSQGVVPAISMAVQAFTEPGDRIVVQSPIYYPFFHMVEKNQRILVNNPLILQEGKYVMNFNDLEQKLSSGAKMLLLCNPHNPVGRVWSKEELTKLGELCLKYNVLVLSDEIHSDLVLKKAVHTPYASISEEFANHSITCIAPSKTFNLAGLQSSVVIIPNRHLRKIFDDYQHRQGYFTLNTFGIVGMEAAYRYGEQWLDALLSYLEGNINFTEQYIRDHLPKLEMIRPEATYLVWINCQNLELTDLEIKHRLIKKGKLAVEPGPKYGEGGEGFIRINIACPRKILLNGLERLSVALND
jgi:cysteine-S-conjugate beta-lyase